MAQARTPLFRLETSLLLAGWLSFVAGAAQASPGPAPENPAAQRLTRRYSPWQSKRATPFVSLASDLGFIYARPRLTLGYGAPFWQFVGLDLHWLSTNSFTQPYVGWRASLPFLDVQTGVRYTYPFDRRIMPRRDSHDAEDLDLDRGGKRSSYFAADLEVTLTLPVLHGGAFLSTHATYVDAPRGIHLYEETSRVVMAPPFVLMSRVGYVYGFGESRDVKLGAVVEHVVATGRPESVVRAGPLALVTFNKHLEGLAIFSPVILSPDNLGLEHGTYAFVGVLHRWARRF